MNPPTTAVGGPWVKTDTSENGTPVVSAVNGKMKLLFDNTSEIQNVSLSFGGQLPYDIDELVRADFWVDVPATLDAATSIAIGMISARNDAIDSIAEAALFRLIGSNALVVETDDGTNNNDDVATGIELGTTTRRLSIDFASGVQTVAPPGVSKGGKGSVLFSAENASGLLRPVAQNQLFDMSNYAGGLQPFVQIQKTADTNVDFVQIKRVRIEYRQGA
jgi:hypothetical protein